MHEMSLAGSILRVVEAAAEREHFVRVTLLRIEAGALAGVEAGALRFALEVMAQDTCLQGARIDIDTQPAAAWCMQCCTSVAMLARGDPCEHCGNAQLQPTSGTELRVVDMMVDDI